MNANRQTIEIVVPVHNEEATVERNVEALLAYMRREFPFRFSVVVAGALAFAAGAVTGYLLNARWTFAARGSWRRYLAVQLGGLGATTVFAALGGTVGYLVALPLVTLSTFTASRMWAFA